MIYDMDPTSLTEIVKFSQTANKSRTRAKGEKLIMEIIERTDGTLHNLNQAVAELVYAEKNQIRRVACNCDLTFGTKLAIKVALYVYVRIAYSIFLQRLQFLRFSSIFSKLMTICFKMFRFVTKSY